MASREPIETVYTKEGVITKNALFTIYKAEINLDKFDYDMLYAYTQVTGLTLSKRALEAEKFALKLSEKNLDNQTIRTILETQNIELPPKSATFIEATNSFDTKFFNNKHNLFLYTQHPNLITIYASGLENDRVYVATESLSNRMPTEKLFETFTIEGKINLLIQVSRAVASLHSNKIIHQNICPENIFALPQANGICQIKLLASGIIPDISNALNVGGGSEFKPLFAFTSPETLAASKTSSINTETEDIYALGGILFFYLSGQRPWQKYRTLFDIIKACKEGEKAINEEDCANITDNLKSVITKATAINPDERYKNIAEFISDLEACRDGNNPRALIAAAQNEMSAEDSVYSEELDSEISYSEDLSSEISQDIAETESLKQPVSDQNANSDKEDDKTIFKSEQKLTEEDLPQPLIEPKIPDINTISPELNHTGSQIWKKLTLAACVILIFGAAGYYFLNSRQDKSQKQAPATTQAPTATAPVKKNISLNIEKKQADEKPTAKELAQKEEEKKKKLEAQKRAEEKRLEEEKRLQQETEYSNTLAAGNKAMENKNYHLAIVEYTKAARLINTSEANNLLQAAKKKQSTKLSYENYLKDAQKLLNDKKLEEAEAIILQAKNITDFANDQRADQIIDTIRKIRFEDALTEGEELLTQEKYEEAELAYAWALSIPGYENNQDALNGRQLVQNTLRKLAEEKLRQETEERNRKSQYNAAIAEAQKLLLQKRWDEAASAFTMALEVPGYTDDQAALQGREDALTNKEHEEQRILEAKKDALQTEFNRQLNNGNIYLKARLWHKAEEAFSKALEIEGYSANEEALAGRQNALTNNELQNNREQYDQLLLDGMNYINNNDFTAAEKSFRDAMLIPGFDNGDAARKGITFAETLNQINTKAKTYNQYLDSGKEKLLNNNAEEAIRDFGLAIVEEPNQMDAYILRGSAYLETGNSEKALDNFNQALDVNPDYEPAILGKAITYFKKEDYSGAVETFSILAAEAEQSDLKTMCNDILGWIYLETDDNQKNDNIAHDNEKAKSYFEQNQTLNDPVALNNLGYMYMYGNGVDKDYKTAIQLFTAAAEKELPEAEFNLGMAYYKGNGVRRNYEKAFEYFKEAAESNTLPIAWGQVAEMYRRGKGVKRNRDLAKEYAAKYNNRTNRDTIYLAGKPRLSLPMPVNHLPETLQPAELEIQYTAFINEGDKLREAEEYDSAERLYIIASMVKDNGDSPEIKEKITEIRNLKNNKHKIILADIIESKRIQEPEDLLTEESLDDISKELASLSSKPKPNQPKTELEDILDSLENSENKTTNNNGDDDLLAGLDDTPTNNSKQDISENKFGKEYVKLINIAEKFLSNQDWSMAEQAFKMALALPSSPDQGDALSGLETAVRERNNANSANSATISNYAAILGNATALLKEGRWLEANYMYKSAIEYIDDDDDTLAQIGLKVAEAANIASTVEPKDTELDIKSDERDIASYNMAIAQSKQFLTDGNFNAAIQMLEIALGMKGFEEDPVASAMLMTANKMKLENDNSPEAIAAKRTKNKPIYDKLMKSGELQIASGNLQGAENSFILAQKIPGYKDDEAAQKGLQQIEELKNRPTVSEEAKEKYNTLMEQGQSALDKSDWSQAEETFRIILSLPEFSNDPDALSGLRAAARAQNKPLPDTGDVTEDILQNGLIPADADLEAIRRRAEFEALVREGKRQLELKQYEVAEAMFNEALKIEGYSNNPDGLSLLRKTKLLKPKEEVVKLPVNNPAPKDPQQDMKHQAELLLNEGNRLRAQKKFDQALQAYNSGIDLDPDNLKLYINRADTNAGIGNFDIALNDYQKVLDTAKADDETKSYTWNNIANVYYYGKKDYASAVEYYRKAAEIGNAASMNSLGICYGFAKGVEKDPQQSLEWYTKAAERGYGNAMLNLGMMYQNGWGIDTDLKLAREWYEKAASHNVPRAFVRLSLMYANGSGVEQDQQKADEYKQKAVELGYTADR